MPQLEARSASIHYETLGAGQPLIMIAGTASDSASWRPLIPFLSPHYSLVLIDNRGSGRTVAAGPIEVADMAADAAALLDHLGLGPVHVVGHSLGGFIALLLAARRPELVGRVVTMGSGVIGARTVALFRQLARLYATLPPEDWFRLLYPCLFSDPFFADEAKVANAAAISASYPFRQKPADFDRQVQAFAKVRDVALSGVVAPVLAVSAELDILAQRRNVVRLHDALQDVQYAEVPAAAHSMHWEAPDAVAALIRRFLG